jgi:hypothetical protein
MTAQASYYNPATPVIGATPAQVAQNAPGIVMSNLSQLTAARIAIFSNNDMVAIYAVTNGAARSVIYAKSSAQGARMDSAVSAARLAGTLTGIAPQMKYVPRAKVQPPSTNMLNTLTQIYTDFLTAPYVTTSPTIAAMETAVYAAEWGGYAWGTGYYIIGPAIRWLIENYSPNTYDAIGGTIDVALGELVDGTSSIEQEGNDELEMAEGFNVGIGEIVNGNAFGSWGVMDALQAAGSLSGCDPENGCN